MRDHFIGIDIGTSSVRAVLFNSSGFQVCIDSIEYSVASSIDGMAELDPEHVFACTVRVIKNCIEKSGLNKAYIAGMGISCQMHSLMAVDSKGNPLTSLIIWMDTRAKKESEFIKNNYDAAKLYNKTGCRVQHPMYPLSKLLWLRNNDIETFRKAYKFITIKEYIILKLYGELAVDYTLAASQGYYNIHKQQWDDEILGEILQIGREKLGEVVECTHAVTGLKTEFAKELGIDAATPAVMGSGDGIMANLGCGVYDDTSLSSTIGTSGAIRTSVNQPLLDPYQRTWCYSFAKDIWVVGGAINNGGIVLKWLREEFKKQFEHDARLYGESIYKVFDRYAAEVKPGSDGLIFLPYLTGERSPDWNADARGLMFGLSLLHGRKHIVRAAMEGVIYRMYSVYEVISQLKDSAIRINANGGYAKSDVWMQIQADIFNKEILVSGVEEASALGAAFLCMFSLGAVKNMKQLLPGMKPRKVIVPIQENHEMYKEAYRRSSEIYEKVYGSNEQKIYDR